MGVISLPLLYACTWIHQLSNTTGRQSSQFSKKIGFFGRLCTTYVHIVCTCTTQYNSPKTHLPLFTCNGELCTLLNALVPAPSLPRNAIPFTPTQVEAIRSGMQPGLTLVVGPPGTGKTDVAVQIISNLYHNFPEQVSSNHLDRVNYRIEHNFQVHRMPNGAMYIHEVHVEICW